MPRLRTNKVVLMFDDHELQQVKEMAGLVPLSTWIRANITGKEIGAESLIPLLQKSIEKSKAVIRKGKVVSNCPHGKESGRFCFDCRGNVK